MGKIIAELVDGYRLVSDEGQYMILDDNWTPCTDSFEEVDSHDFTSAVLVINGNHYDIAYEDETWTQCCRSTGDDELYCNSVRCDRHPAYGADIPLSSTEPTLTASEYQDWKPPILVRLYLLATQNF